MTNWNNIHLNGKVSIPPIFYFAWYHSSIEFLVIALLELLSADLTQADDLPVMMRIRLDVPYYTAAGFLFCFFIIISLLFVYSPRSSLNQIPRAMPKKDSPLQSIRQSRMTLPLDAMRVSFSPGRDRRTLALIARGRPRGEAPQWMCHIT